MHILRLAKLRNKLTECPLVNKVQNNVLVWDNVKHTFILALCPRFHMHIQYIVVVYYTHSVVFSQTNSMASNLSCSGRYTTCMYNVLYIYIEVCHASTTYASCTVIVTTIAKNLYAPICTSLSMVK